MVLVLGVGCWVVVVVVVVVVVASIPISFSREPVVVVLVVGVGCWVLVLVSFRCGTPGNFPTYSKNKIRVYEARGRSRTCVPKRDGGSIRRSSSSCASSQ